MNRRVLVILFVLFIPISLFAGKSNLEKNINWEKFLSRHDLKWDVEPIHWHEAPFVGNGLLGSMIYVVDKHTIRWDFNNSRNEDHRKDEPGGIMMARPKLPTGCFTLTTVGEIIDADIRLDLWNAEIIGTFYTTKGEIKFRTLIHADKLVMLNELKPSSGEREIVWRWQGAEAISPRATYASRKTGWWPKVKKPENPNPEGFRSRKGAIDLYTQSLSAGGETVTGWAINYEQDHSQTILATIAHTYPETNAKDIVIERINDFSQIEIERNIEDHRNWWHKLYPKSFVSFPDSRWESFYWIQLYKFACATRSDRPMIGLQGVWDQATPWPGYWWNLNAQLTYWPVYTWNHLELGESLTKTLDKNIQNLINNCPPEFRDDCAVIGRTSSSNLVCPIDDRIGPNNTRGAEIGNLTWVLHNYWLHYRHSMDKELLKDKLYPLLKRSVNYYLKIMEKGSDGKYHLPITVSPEFGATRDANYDLAIFRWGCIALLEANNILKLNDPLKDAWQDALDNLVEYQRNDQGLLQIGQDLKYNRGHRHFSHLLMFYPFYELNVEQPGAAEDIRANIKNWSGKGNWSGAYAFAGASSMYSAIGDGNNALRYFEKYTDFIQPNTFYREAGPVIETPFFYVQCIHNMMFQSWGNKLRFFPAMPDAWEDAVFHDLRAEGGFLVSGKYEKGHIKFIRIKSLSGEKCVVKAAFDGEIKVTGINNRKVSLIAEHEYQIDLKKGEEVVISITNVDDFQINPLPGVASEFNRWGKNQGRTLRGFK
ncbi:alpha-L-fucosidase [Puteibacter caeruleilacunae]|nr:alpha-L-fucosidase [Puteibacter caeruleilacunae]